MLFNTSKKIFREQIKPLIRELYNNYKTRAEQLKEELTLPDNPPPYLKNRVVWCFDCNAKRQLTTNSGSSQVVCDTCSSHNWEHYTNKYFVPYEIVVINAKTGERKLIL